MDVKNIVGKQINIDWINDLNDLQPTNVKRPFNFENTKKSIIKYGFTVPFAVWNNKGKHYAIDGHLRKEVLLSIVADGIVVPKLLPAYEVEAKNRKDAIKILVDCYNMKHNPFDKDVLIEWFEEEEIEKDEISIEALNISFEEYEEGNEEGGEESNNRDDFIKQGSFPLAISLNKNEYTKWQAFKRAHHLRNDTDAFINLLNNID